MTASAEERAKALFASAVEIPEGVNSWDSQRELIIARIAQAIRQSERDTETAILADIQDLPLLEHPTAGVVYCANSVDDTIIGPTKRRPPASKKD